MNNCFVQDVNKCITAEVIKTFSSIMASDRIDLDVHFQKAVLMIIIDNETFSSNDLKCVNFPKIGQPGSPLL